MREEKTSQRVLPRTLQENKSCDLIFFKNMDLFLNGVLYFSQVYLMGVSLLQLTREGLLLYSVTCLKHPFYASIEKHVFGYVELVLMIVYSLNS